MKPLQSNIKSNCFIFLLALTQFMLFSKVSAQQTDSTKLVIAEIKTIHSKILGEDRKIYIYKPGQSPYYLPQASPVLYLMDGDAHTALVASQVQYLSEMYAELPTMIIVGISNYSYDRFRDLTPTHSSVGYDGNADTSSSSVMRTSGGGDKFLQFIKEEVMPYVEANYNTLPYKILSGHSLGGLMSVHCLTANPGLFNAYLAVSPSLWWDGGSALKQASGVLKANSLKTKTLFFSDGSEGAGFHKDVLKLDTMLQQNNTGVQYKYVYYPDESHGAEPVKAEYDGLRFIFSKWMPAATDTTAALIKKHYEAFPAEYGFNILPPEAIVNTQAYTLMNDPGKINDAIDLLELNVANYPASFNVYDSLGDGYAKKGDKEKAIANYKKALELNPASAETKTKLQALEK